MHKNLIIIRGVPGSGKSTFATLLGRAICTADDYFTRDKVYSWNPEKIHLAHQWCQRKCERFMTAGINPVIVANTSVKDSEVNIYIKMAEKYGYKPFSIIVENRHGGKNIHNVPTETIEKMKSNFNIKL